MFRRISLGLAIALAVCPPAVACDTPETCLAEIERAQSGAGALSADFTQTKYVSLLDEPLVSSGTFSFVPPAQVRWTVETPQRFEVKIDGERVDIPGMTESDRQYVAMAPIAGMFRQLGAIFTGSVAGLRDEFEVAAVDGSQTLELTLTPRREAGRKALNRIVVRFARPQLMLQRVEIHDPLGDRLVVEMSNVRRASDSR